MTIASKNKIKETQFRLCSFEYQNGNNTLSFLPNRYLHSTVNASKTCTENNKWKSRQQKPQQIGNLFAQTANKH